MKTLAVCAGLLAAFFITACGYETVPTTGSKLRGTWISNDPEAVYKGTLVINISNTINQIKITGYGESQTPPKGDDNNRPFKKFTKGTFLKCRWDIEEGESEGTLFITDGGKEQEGIPFVYYEGATWQISSFEKRTDKFLSFTFGSRVEKLESEYNYHEKPLPDNTSENSAKSGYFSPLQ
jgi:hypothetical protein